MSHMVIFRTAEGKASYQQAEALEEAVRFVERLRNEESVEHARIFRLEEVGFEFRPFFRVELTGAQQLDGEAAEPVNGNGSGHTAAEAVDDDESVDRGADDGESADRDDAADHEDGRSRRGLFR